jgi:hypothetical protein
MRLLTIAAAMAITLLPALAQEDGLGVPGPIEFEETPFALAWTSNPSPEYFKQEYLPEGEALESYIQMFIVEAVTSGATPQGAVDGMVATLNERKASDPVVNFALIENEASGELLLDFLLSDTSSGEVIVEWNAYRYVPLGEDGVALYAISRRGYGDEASGFIGSLKEWRQGSISALANMDLPPISVD